MEIIVCIKPVLDPDLPPMKFSIDAQKNCVIPPEGMPAVMNPYDALAVEAALQIKEKQKGKVTVITLGSGEDVQRKALAMGADEAVIVKVEGLQEFDGPAKASLLSCAIKKIGSYDLVICGRQAADWDLGVTGSMTAEYLGIPVLTRAKKIEITDGKLRIERITANGNETYETVLPALVTVSSEMGKPRIPSGWGIINATKKSIISWSQSDLGDNHRKVLGRNPLLKLYASSNERKCELIAGKNTEEAAGRLADLIANMTGK
ncbi:MAG: electron transfer flavoprotein subunit beta/FixA family protein [Smithellaceae bacterium]